MSKVYDIWTVG